MTLPVQTRYNQYTGNGVTTVFPYTFRLFDVSHLVVTVDDVEKTYGVDYTVSGIDITTGGNVTFTVAPANASIVLLDSTMPYSQLTAYAEGTDFPASSHEKALDRNVALLQEMKEKTDNAIAFPAGDTAVSTLPSKTLRASKVLGFDALGEFDVVDPDTQSAVDAAASAAAAAASASQAAVAVATFSYPNKGDIRVGSGLGATAVLAVGTDGQVLVADSGQAAGVKYVTLPPGTSPWGNEFYS